MWKDPIVQELQQVLEALALCSAGRNGMSAANTALMPRIESRIQVIRGLAQHQRFHSAKVEDWTETTDRHCAEVTASGAGAGAGGSGLSCRARC